jgi:hypothetical protein
MQIVFPIIFFSVVLFSLTYSVNVHSMELSLLEELVLSWIALQLTTVNGTPKFHYHVPKSSPLVSALSFMNSVYTLTSIF